MTDALRDALCDRLDRRTVLGGVAALVVLWTVLDPTGAQFAVTVGSMLLLGFVDALSDAYDLRQSVANVGVGGYALLGGLSLALFDGGSMWAPAALLVAGCWFVLDAIQTVRHDGATESESDRDGHEVYRAYVARRVHETLLDRPRTGRELVDELEADEGAIDAAVDRLIERGVVVREGSELRVPSRDRGRLDRARDWAGRVARRIARPVRIEFERGAADGGTHDRSADGPVAAADREPTESTARDRPADGDANGRRERVTETAESLDR